MKQIVYDPDGRAESMRLADAPRPVPAAGEILIEVHHAGVNRPDLLQRSGRYPPPPGASPVLGLEVAGTVAELGKGVTQWQTGDRVCALVPGGGYAQFCVTAAAHALPVPEGFDTVQAAALPETWFTVWVNLVGLARLRQGERLLVHGGSSGIGLTAIQLAQLRGVECLVTVGSEEKAQFCREFGAAHAINYRESDFLQEVRNLTAGEGVDVVLDMVGAAYFQKNLSALRRDGRLVMIAFLEGAKAQLDLMPIMLKRLIVTGSTLRARSLAEKAAIRDELFENVWPQMAAGRLRPHIHALFPLSEAGAAHRLMESSRHMGKIILEVKS